MDAHVLIGRALAVTNPEVFKRIQDRVTPMLTNMDHIPSIVDYTRTSNQDYDKYMLTLLTVASIYDIYCPGALFAKSIAKMQIGVRDEVAKVIGYRNSEMVNYFLSRAIPFLKFREKDFGQRVERIKEAFKHLSVRGHDWELSL